MQERVNLGKAGPDLYQAMLALEGQLQPALAAAGIDKGFSHLLRLRASQINQCAFCVRMHARDALAAGETQDRISVLPAWRETGYFSDLERAALELVESVTLVATDQVPDAVYERVAAVLSQDQIAAVAWLGVVINAWNRIAMASRYLVNP
ncbi:MAG: carboxymuconolactone decarboxylase family protein [Burkholderiales bacterium]|nr:carboxymuconolactone decarboxylase family protein [Burkholderiales bacterium]MBK8665834.1 carboxymuconolactone decarboxylase family protein [Burkholderiales bacterium]